MQTEITIKDLTRVEVRPGDTILLRAAHHINSADAARLREQWLLRFPDNPVVVMNGDIEVAVLRTEAGEDG